ncbi:MAG: hypothetical protein IJK89_05965 [Clostridia bacterium]|nr:hypothetical protein [Clostridia bacterium]
MDHYLVFDREPFVGFMPDDLRDWLKTHRQESDIALLVKLIHEKTAYVADGSDETGDVWAHYAYEEWFELEIELIELIKEILSAENRTKGTNYPLEGLGTHYVIRPFMERNGYRDCSGWWIKEE